LSEKLLTFYPSTILILKGIFNLKMTNLSLSHFRERNGIRFTLAYDFVRNIFLTKPCGALL